MFCKLVQNIFLLVTIREARLCLEATTITLTVLSINLKFLSYDGLSCRLVLVQYCHVSCNWAPFQWWASMHWVYKFLLLAKIINYLYVVTCFIRFIYVSSLKLRGMTPGEVFSCPWLMGTSSKPHMVGSWSNVKTGSRLIRLTWWTCYFSLYGQWRSSQRSASDLIMLLWSKKMQKRSKIKKSSRFLNTVSCCCKQTLVTWEGVHCEADIRW